MAKNQSKKFPRISHSECEHEDSKYARHLCRQEKMAEAGLIHRDARRVTAASETPQKRGARTRARNRAMEQRAQVVDGLLEATEEQSVHRNSAGRFTRETLDQWNMFLSSVEGAEEYLAQEGGVLTEASLSMSLAGYDLTATYRGGEWTVEVVR